MTDKIIQEAWRAKAKIAKDFHYDIDALAAELQRRQKESGREIVNLAKQAAEEYCRTEPLR